MVSWITLTTVTVLVSCCVSPVQGLAFQSCDTSVYGGITIESNAQAFIGLLMSLREMGEGGYGCGDLATSEELPQAYEAMKWALDRLNQDTGTINGETITDSYVPGVKIGKLVWSKLDFLNSYFGH